MKKKYIKSLKNYISILATIAVLYLAITSDKIAQVSADSGEKAAVMVTKISDGDTFHAYSNGESFRVRLAYIDCPEKDQPRGQAATDSLRSAIQDKPVSLNIVDTDRYGRKVAEVLVDETSINLQLVRTGKCYVYRKYAKGQDEYFQAEALAEKERLGVHKNRNAIKPWDWRRMR